MQRRGLRDDLLVRRGLQERELLLGRRRLRRATCGDGCKDAKLSVCDGAGTCLAPAPCAGNLACDSAKACRSTCAEDAHCIGGYRCVDGKCAPKPTSSCSGDGLSSISTEPGGTPHVRHLVRLRAGQHL
ncbi:MAG: hypothetical protein HYV09_01080 [Deltaproteobacteria bacterium]|nr:hypothetical protein [Deltaproteobacteria bacterium]